MKGLLPILALALAGCTTTAPTGTSTVTPAQAAVITQDTATILAPVLLKNPSYKPAVLALGNELPGLAANGPITVSTYTGAIMGIPGLPAQEAADLAIGGGVLDLALSTYTAFNGKSVALYTDPNVAAIVNAFAAGLVQASK